MVPVMTTNEDRFPMNDGYLSNNNRIFINENQPTQTKETEKIFSYR